MRDFLLALVLIASTAHAEKPTLAVLGVAPKDHALVANANAITATIRAQAKSYTLKGTPKQITKLSDAADCSALEPACSTKLGVALGADYAIAGELERRGEHQILTLALVDVAKKQRIRSLRDTVAIKGDMKKWARTAYNKLVDGEAGELVIAANAQNGEVWIDGQLAGALFEGRASVGGLANGGHQLAIRAKGFKPLEVEITVEFETKQSFLLEPE